MSYVDLNVKDGKVVATHTSDAEEITELRKRIDELEAECNDLAHQLNQCNERGGHIIAENKRLKKEVASLYGVKVEALRNPSVP